MGVVFPRTIGAVVPLPELRIEIVAIVTSLALFLPRSLQETRTGGGAACCS
jgi:hypothetical protein